MTNKTFTYIAGPYAGDSHDYKSYEQIDAHIAQCRGAAKRLAIAGIPYFAPHMNSAHFEVIAPTVPPDYWYKMDNIFVDLSSALLLLPNWEKSKGAQAEATRAIGLKLPIYKMFDSVVGDLGSFEDLQAWWFPAKDKISSEFDTRNA